MSYHQYHGIAFDDFEREEIAKNLGPVNTIMILRSYGLLAMGRTVEEAFCKAYEVVRACEMQVY